MSANTIASLWGGQIASFGLAALAVLSATLVIAIALLVYRFGVWKLLNDRSLEIGGYYLRDTPYKGYNRFRSKEWNMTHTM